MIEFTPWPEHLADRYRRQGYWAGHPLTAAVTRQTQTRPDAVALICGERSFSYAALDRLAGALAVDLAARGLGHGDTALVQLPNIAEFHIVFQALMRIGVVPLNALFSHRQSELTAYAAQIAPALVIADRAHPAFADDTLLDRIGARHVLLRGNAASGPGRDLDAAIHGAGALPAGVNPTLPRPTLPRPTLPGQVAFFQLSGGSTGTPKLIPRTHDDYDYSIRESARICGLTPDTRFLAALPAPHNYILSSPGALGVFHAGGTVVMAASPDPALCLPLIARHRVTMAALVPSAVGLWLDAARRYPGALDSLRLLQVGGASFPEATARRVTPELGCKLQQVFGMAEGLVNYTRLDDPPEVIATTQGRPISPDDEIRVLDPETHLPVPDGQSGLLATRGPYTIRGYYRAPDENARAFTADGFYLTGDLVRRVGGNLQVVGRVKDQINRGGEKIAAEEIEALLHNHPAVRQAALVAAPDPVMGEKSCAFVVADGLRGVDLRRHLMGLGIADYKLPDRFRFLDSLPLTAVGKPDKRRLREMLTETV